MKTKNMIMLFLLICGIASAKTKNEIDSLRQTVLIPKIRIYHAQINEYTALIKATGDTDLKKYYAKKIIAKSNSLEEEIKELFDYKTVCITTPVYVATIGSSQSTKGALFPGLSNVLNFGNYNPTPAYPVLDGFIFVTTFTTIGSLPDLFEEIGKIKDSAWGIRFSFNSEMEKRNVERIVKSNENLKVG